MIIIILKELLPDVLQVPILRLGFSFHPFFERQSCQFPQVPPCPATRPSFLTHPLPLHPQPQRSAYPNTSRLPHQMQSPCEQRI